MKTRLLLSFLLVPLLSFAQEVVPTATPPQFDAVFQEAAVWETPTATALETTFQSFGFRWVSATKDAARSVLPGLTFAKQPVNEAILRFRDGKLSSSTALFYSRGTAGDLGEDAFDGKVASLREALTALFGKPPTERGKDATSAVKAEGAIWETDISQYLLEWSATKGSRSQMIPFRAEFIRLSVAPKNTQERAIGAVTSTNAHRDAIKKFSGLEHVEKAPSGEVKLKDIPMVDQGDKGYCVVASVERVMRYYGVEVDQDELAQLANSDADKGTSTASMSASLNKLSARLGVKCKTLYAFDYKEFMDIMNGYNRATKRGKVAPEVDLGGMVINIDQILSGVNPDLFKEVRLKKTADFGKFQREIQRSIDDGIPLLWSVQIGIIKEPGLSQASGGHMRLIFGYNSKTQEILYTDSWGMGHEEKRMPVADAWTMTTGLSSLQPIGT